MEAVVQGVDQAEVASADLHLHRSWQHAYQTMSYASDCPAVTQVAELFELEVQSKAGLRAASRREVLAAMLAAVRDAHWCRAVGCHPEPGLMTPIDLQTVATGKVQPMNGCDVSRALASAERRLFLLPESRCATCLRLAL